jgi:hypothetical protein
MARIRSIKPEFFTSETLAKVSKSARLTFIGLWTYVDDNGVGLDNDRLIAAALYALEEDPLEALRSVADDLKSLSSVGVITRYEFGGRRYLFITNWLEHQKVSHPAKPRYPRPAPADFRPPTSEDADPPEDQAQPSGNAPEDYAQASALSREQGAGSKEQGDTRSADAETHETDSKPKRRRRAPGYVAARFAEFYAAYPRKKSPADAETAWTKAVDTLGADPAVIIEAARLFAMANRTKDPEYLPYPATWLNRRQWEDKPDRAPDAPSAIGAPSVAAAAAPRPLADVLAEQRDHGSTGFRPPPGDEDLLTHIGMSVDDR